MRYDAFGALPASAPAESDKAKPDDAPPASQEDAEKPLVRRAFMVGTFKKLDAVAGWKVVNRDTDQSRPMTTADGRMCCVQRKRTDTPDGPTYRYLILMSGNDVFQPTSLEDLLQVMSIKPMRMTRR